MSYRILAINPGSTSTKIAVYDNEKQILVKSIDHKVEDLEKYDKVQEQFEMRKEKVLKALKENNIKLDSLSAIVGRGGLLPPVKSGAYLVNDEMIDRLVNRPTLDHASNLGAMISYSIANEIGVNSYIYDPVSVDESNKIAKVSGLKELDRVCLTHALNTRAMAIKYAKMHNKDYKNLNLIVAHLGGGISLNVHEKGRMVDFVTDEEGPFSPERAGKLPSKMLVDLCYSGKYTYEEMAGNKQIKIEGLDEPEPMAYEPEESYNSGEESLNDESVLNGEFVPKERIIVSQSAKDAMKRKPYGMEQAASGIGGTSGTSVSSCANATAGQSDAVIDLEAENMQQSGVTAQTEVKKNSSEGKIIAPKKKKMSYKKPPYKLLADNPGSSNGTTKAVLMQTANKLKEVLTNFGVKVEVTNVSKGPSVTRYELQPEMGTKVSRITGLADDIKLNMAAADIRIEAPIPGKAAVGIEIPNDSRDTVYLKELLMSKELKEHKSKLAFPAGKDIAGRVVVADIAKMPHMLIAGTTGSGKSVFTNSILMSILYRTTPEEVRIIVIDPKVVEFQVYNKIPHLLYDVVTDPKKAAGILNWAVAEMTTRYKKFANIGARDISSYNAKVESGDYSEDEQVEKMPQILIIIDELADLMMVAAKEVEEAICRLAQLARAAGIHMVIATQRPSVDVITGLIKANIPSRVALTVASGTDSRTIIDMNGAEKLLGNGDMLFYPAGYVKPVRIQGAYVSEKEISDTVNYIKEHSGEAEYDDTIDAKLTTDQEAMANGGELDPYFAQAGRLCIEKQKGSTSMIQRQFKVGFNRAARIMEQLYDAGVVGQEESNKPRKVIMSIEAFEQMVNGGQ